MKNEKKLILNPAAIPEEGVRIEGQMEAGSLFAEQDPHFRETAPPSYSLFAQVVCEELIVRGKVSASAETDCSRCAKIFSTSVEDSDFLRVYSLQEGMEDVDVGADIREELLLRLPHFPLCSESCKGLCPQCGKDLNEGPCSCKDDAGPGAWDALDQLKF